MSWVAFALGASAVLERTLSERKKVQVASRVGTGKGSRSPWMALAGLWVAAIAVLVTPWTAVGAAIDLHLHEQEREEVVERILRMASPPDSCGSEEVRRLTHDSVLFIRVRGAWRDFGFGVMYATDPIRAMGDDKDRKGWQCIQIGRNWWYVAGRMV
jgi:hypothetical protein